jgi:uncharacterized protein
MKGTWMIDQKLLDILACPACENRPGVTLRDGELLCGECGRAYPIRDDIPVMLVDQARFVERVGDGGGK